MKQQYKLQWVENNPTQTGDQYYLAPVDGVGCFCVTDGGYGDPMIQFHPFVDAEDHTMQDGNYWPVNVRSVDYSGDGETVEELKAMAQTQLNRWCNA